MSNFFHRKIIIFFCWRCRTLRWINYIEMWNRQKLIISLSARVRKDATAVLHFDGISWFVKRQLWWLYLARLQFLLENSIFNNDRNWFWRDDKSSMQKRSFIKCFFLQYIYEKENDCNDWKWNTEYFQFISTSFWPIESVTLKFVLLFIRNSNIVNGQKVKWHEFDKPSAG